MKVVRDRTPIEHKGQKFTSISDIEMISMLTFEMENLVSSLKIEVANVLCGESDTTETIYDIGADIIEMMHSISYKTHEMKLTNLNGITDIDKAVVTKFSKYGGFNDNIVLVK